VPDRVIDERATQNDRRRADGQAISPHSRALASWNWNEETILSGLAIAASVALAAMRRHGKKPAESRRKIVKDLCEILDMAETYSPR